MPGGDKIYLAFITEPYEVGQSTKRSPQHLTLIHPFPADNRQSALESMEVVKGSFGQFLIRVAEKTMFGPNNDIPVYLIRPIGILRALHSALLIELEQRGTEFTDRRYLRERYIPHIAIKTNHPDLEKGQTLTVDHIALMLKHEKTKTLLATSVLREIEK